MMTFTQNKKRNPMLNNYRINNHYCIERMSIKNDYGVIFDSKFTLSIRTQHIKPSFI